MSRELRATGRVSKWVGGLPTHSLTHLLTHLALCSMLYCKPIHVFPDGVLRPGGRGDNGDTQTRGQSPLALSSCLPVALILSARC
jgi:hypothetical protein